MDKIFRIWLLSFLLGAFVFQNVTSQANLFVPPNMGGPHGGMGDGNLFNTHHMKPASRQLPPAGDVDKRRAKGDFRNIPRRKIYQEQLPRDTRLYIAPKARIDKDRDYEDGKGY